MKKLPKNKKRNFLKLFIFKFSLPLFLLLILCSQNDFYLNTIDIKLEETMFFPGNMSLEPEEAYLALKHCSFDKTIKILEFGAGESTNQFAKILTEKQIPFEYHVFENDPSYIKTIENVTFHYYELPKIPFKRSSEWNVHVAKYILPDLPIFDLIIVDGPHGVGRAQWHQKFKKYTRPGTILLIDDFHHFKEFEQALDKNFEYETIIEYNQNPKWKIINIGIDPTPNYFINKTFKIVKVQ